MRPIPKGWDFFDAAGLFVTAPTSYAGLVTRAGVKKGWFLPMGGQCNYYMIKADEIL